MKKNIKFRKVRRFIKLNRTKIKKTVSLIALGLLALSVFLDLGFDEFMVGALLWLIYDKIQ